MKKYSEILKRGLDATGDLLARTDIVTNDELTRSVMALVDAFDDMCRLAGDNELAFVTEHWVHHDGLTKQAFTENSTPVSSPKFCSIAEAIRA